MTKETSFETRDESRFGKHLAWRMVLLLVPISVVLAMILGISVYSQTRNLLEEQTNNQIVRFIDQVQINLDNWLSQKHYTVEQIVKSPNFLEQFEGFSDGEQQVDPQSLRTIIEDAQPAMDGEQITPLFRDYVLTDPQGKMYSASNAELYSQIGDNGAVFTVVAGTEDPTSFIRFNPIAFVSEDTAELYDVTLITTHPVRNDQGVLLGYLAALSTSQDIQSVLEASSGYLPDNNLFLVNEAGEFAGITDLNSIDSLTLHTPNSAQTDLVFAGLDESQKATKYTSTNGESVFGLYTFYVPLNIGFVVEYPSEYGMAASNGSALKTYLSITGFALLIGGFIFLATLQLTKPIRELALNVKTFAGGDWETRAAVKTDDEIGLLAYSFNNFANDLFSRYQAMENSTGDNNRQVFTAAEVSNLTSTSSSMDELLGKTVNLISERFGFFHTAIYLIDQSKEFGKIRAASGAIGKNLIAQDHQIELTPGSPYYWVVRNNQVKITDEIEGDFLDLDLMPGAKSKTLIPISIGLDVFGLIEIQSADTENISEDLIETLHLFANQLASAVQNFRLLEGTEVDLQQVNELFLASQKISNASTEDEVFNAVVSGVQQTSFYASFYVAHPTGMTLLQPMENKPFYSDQLPVEIPLSDRLAYMFFEDNEPILVRDVNAPVVSIRPELLIPAKALNCHETALLPIIIENNLRGLLVLSSREPGKITKNSIQPFLAFSNLTVTGLDKVYALRSTQQTLDNFETVNELSKTIGNETDPASLYPVIHEQIRSLLGEVDFYIALYDKDTNYIQIPYLYEGDQPVEIEPFPLGEGLTSIVIRTQKPLMLVEKTEERALSLGAKIVGEPAKSWLGIPLLVAGEVIGIISVQDPENEFRFSNDDLVLLTTLSTTIASAIRSANLLSESENRAFQLQTVAEISRETSTTLDRDELLKYSLQLIQDRFNFYHASVFIMDQAGEFAVVQESTGEAGMQMKAEGHKLKVGSQSIIGYVTQNREPLVVNDVTQDPTHRFNPLLPDTRAELGIPILLGDKVLGALDVQSTQPLAFSADDIEILQILADQLAIAMTNADLFTETQDHLAQHRLIHHVTTVAASSTNIEDALSGAVQGLQVTLGDRISILLKDNKTNTLRVQAATGYSNDVYALRIKIGQGITGWAAEHSEAVIVNDVLQDSRYIPGNDLVRSEMAVPLVYRGELLGILNIESDTPNAFGEHDQDILGTLASSLSAIIVNARLSERQRQLFDITNKIRQSVNMETILETTASELSQALQARRTRIQIGGDIAGLSDTAGFSSPSSTTPDRSSGNGQEGEA